jgi:MFS family permease
VVIPRIVPDPQLVQANSNMQFISGATSVAGPLLGALLLGSIGYAGAFLVNAASFFISGSLIGCMRGSLDPEAGPVQPGREGVRGGFRFISGNPRLLVILIVIFGVHLFFGSLAVVFPFLANRLAGKGIFNLGFLEAALGFGILAGSAALGLTRREPRENALFQALGMLGIAILSLGAYQAFGIATPRPYAGSIIVIGACVATASVFWTTLMQRAIPDRIAGRIFAMASAIGNIALPLAYGLFGLLLSVVSITSILVGCGATILAIAAVAGSIYRSTEWKDVCSDPTAASPS